jgi:hypothetical protein
MGDLHVGKLSSIATENSLLHHSSLRYGTHQDIRKRKRTIFRYVSLKAALGKLDFWKQSLHNIYQGEKPQPEPISICLHNAIRTNPLTQGYFSQMIKVRATEITNRSISSMADMRKMADDSKSTLLALNLELLRIEITDSHMQEAISYLGQAVKLNLLRLESVNI